MFQDGTRSTAGAAGTTQRDYGTKQDGSEEVGHQFMLHRDLRFSVRASPWPAVVLIITTS